MQLFQRLTNLLRGNASQTTKPTSQPIPQVTFDDVERIVRRDFTADEYVMVTAMLDEYGTETWHRGLARVRLAALKMANGNVQKLRACIDSAKRDYRDALVAAEYPSYFMIGFRGQKLPEKEQRRIIDEDWRQYQEWLKK